MARKQIKTERRVSLFLQDFSELGGKYPLNLSRHVKVTTSLQWQDAAGEVIRDFLLHYRLPFKIVKSKSKQ